MKLFELATDPEKDTSGVWIVYPDTTNGNEPAEFLIASSSSLAYRKALNAEVRKRFHRKWLEDVEAREEAEIQAQAKAILLGWRGAVYLTTDTSAPTPYTKENAIAALHIPPFKAWVESEANNLENFQNQEIAADKAAIKSGAAVGAEVRQAGRVSERTSPGSSQP